MIDQIAFDWEDVRVFLALLEADTLRQAAERLRIDPSTAARRLSRLEETVGAKLFERSRTGLSQTAAAEQLATAARHFARAAASFEHARSGLEREPVGDVVVSAPTGIANLLVVPLLGELRQRHPGLRIHLDTNNAYVDLDRHEADLALRGARSGESPRGGETLVAVSLGTSTVVPVASPGYAATVGTVHDLADVRWVTFGKRTESFSWARKVLDNVPADAIVLRSDDANTVFFATLSGLGATWMNRGFCDGTRLVELPLERRLAGLLDETESLWLVTHRSLREVPRIAAVWSFLRERLVLSGP